jgi:hypothetical protein
MSLEKGLGPGHEGQDLTRPILLLKGWPMHPGQECPDLLIKDIMRRGEFHLIESWVSGSAVSPDHDVAITDSRIELNLPCPEFFIEIDNDLPRDRKSVV